MFNPFKRKRQIRPPSSTPQWFKWGILLFLVLVMLVGLQGQDNQPSPIQQAMHNISGELPKRESYASLIPQQVKIRREQLQAGQGRPALCGQRMSAQYTASYQGTQQRSGEVTLVNMPGGDASRLTSLLAAMQPGATQRLITDSPVTIGYLLADDAPEPVDQFDLTLSTLLPNVSELFPQQNLGIKLFDDQLGEGGSVICGDTVTISYQAFSAAGTRQANGTISFVIGSGKAIAGVEQGVIGMQPGGVRTLILPYAWQQHLYNHPSPHEELAPSAKKQLMVVEVTLDK